MRKLKESRRPEILEAALVVAAERGLDGLSMRNVAKHMGLTPMALYGYFSSKDVLLDALVGHLLSGVPIPEPDIDWRETILRLALGMREVAHRHPSVFPLLFTRPAVSPAAVSVIDVVFQALLRAGVRPEDVPRIERMISTFVLGHVVSEVSGRFAEGSLDTRSRRTQLEPGMLPGHQRLAEYLDAPADGEEELRSDLDDLLHAVVRNVPGVR